MPTRFANAAIPARLRRDGHGNGFAKRCAHGKRATALRRPHMTGRARTHAGAAAKRSHEYKAKNGPHRPPSPICTAAGRRPAPTPSPAPERPGHNAVVTRTLALGLVICERGRRRSPHTPRPFVSAAATRASALGDCWARGSDSEVCLPVAADRAAGKHLDDSRNRGKAGALADATSRSGRRRRRETRD